jgi:hypothetical protein
MVPAVIERSNGNYALAPRMARHKSMTTTLNVYNEGISNPSLSDGMEQFQKSLTK